VTQLNPFFAALLVFALSSLGCDGRAREREEEALRNRPPVSTGTINQAMSAEPAAPRLPTLDERLLLAIRQGDREGVERRLADGASIDRDAALLVAAVRGKGDRELLEWLVARGAGIDAADDAGRTPLSWAAGRGSLEIVSYLLEQEADATKADQLGRTPLHFAVFSGSEAVVERLLEAPVDVDAQDSLGSTALMYACAKNQRDVVQTLRERGADPDLRDKLGRTAAERAHGDPNPCR
jgi:ankyrin repeat protein